MPVTNAAELIGSDTTGPAPGVTLSTHTGDYHTLADGVVRNLRITGETKIKHDVTFEDCVHEQSIYKDPQGTSSTVRNHVRLNRCKVVAPFGYSSASGGKGFGIHVTDLIAVRTELAGFEDLTHPWGGEWEWIDSYAHSPCWDPDSLQSGGTHCDPFETRGHIPSNPGHELLLIVGSRLDTFPFQIGQPVGSRIGQHSPKSATSGVCNFETGKCKNTYIYKNFIWGDFSQMFYFLDKGEDHPQPNGIFDNIFRRFDGREMYGSHSLLNGGSNADGSGKAPVDWGRNYDYDTGAEVAGGYTSPTNINAILTEAGPASSYPQPSVSQAERDAIASVYGEEPQPEPTGEVWIPSAERDAMVNAYLAAQTGGEAARDAWLAIREQLAGYPINPA